MNVMNFFKSLLPSFERSRVIEDLEQLSDYVKGTLQPSYKKAAEVMSGKKFGAKVTQDFNAIFTSELPQFKHKTFVEGTSLVLTDLLAKLAVIQSQFEELFEAADITKETITYRKAAVLRYLEIATFASNYAGRALIRFTAAEAAVAMGRPNQIDAEFTPAEIKWLQSNFNGYIQSMQLLARPTSELASALETIPDITIVADKEELVKQAVGANKLDPLRMNFIAARFNVIYHFRLAVAEWQVSLYKARQEEKRTLELRILQLKQAYEGKEDAKLAQNIEYSTGRLQRLNYALAKQEEEYA